MVREASVETSPRYWVGSSAAESFFFEAQKLRKDSAREK